MQFVFFFFPSLSAHDVRLAYMACCFRSEIAFPARLAERLSSRFKLAASLEGRRHALRSPATTFYPCSTFLAEAPESVFAHWRSVEAWYRDDPSLLRWRLRPPGTSSGRPDQSSTRRNRRSTRILLISFGALHSRGILVLPGEAESGSAGVQPDEE